MVKHKLNIIYFVCHDLGKHLGCYGVPVESPNLDRFAAEGIKLTNAFCASPACSPSRGCAMTGQYAHNNGLMGLVNGGWSMPEDSKTIVDYLNEAGYETAHYGFSHERHPIKRNHYRIDEEGGPETRFIENVIDRAIVFLERNRGRQQPFYLNLASQEVHASFWKKDGWINRTPTYGIVPPEKSYIPDYMPDVPYFRDMMGRFQGAIRYMDEQIQRLFDAIERMGYNENTLVIFTTDHGPSGYRAKGTLYDRGVEIAFMMKMPGVATQGMVVDDLISNIDLVPTLLEACALEIPKEVQGRSFWKRIAGKPYKPNETLFTERNYHGGIGSQDYDPVRSVRTKQFHYIRNFNTDVKRYRVPSEFGKHFDHEWWHEADMPRDQEELYDIEADPAEFNNVAHDPKYVRIKQELAAEMDHWMKDTDDPLLRGDIPDRMNPWPE